MQMAEIAIAVTQLGAFNRDPGYAIACDGGSSTTMGVIDGQGKSLLSVQGLLNESSAVNFVALASSNPPKPTEDATAKRTPYVAKP
jgi:hypothetical protein